jgi:hypothetical protein
MLKIPIFANSAAEPNPKVATTPTLTSSTSSTSFSDENQETFLFPHCASPSPNKNIHEYWEVI